jgi:hypothetical protein
VRRTITASLIIGLSLMASAVIITYGSPFHTCMRALEAAMEKQGRGLSQPERVEFCQR